MVACTRRVPSDAMPTLYLLRHAKSDYPPGVADRDRPLAPRGERDARAAAAWFAATVPTLDTVIVSPAVRAQQTWSAVAPSVSTGSVHTDERVYDDWGSGLSSLIATLPATLDSALLVGHNPGIEEVALSLAASGDARSLERLRAKYPTCAIAVLRLDAWGHRGDLAGFAVPRG